MKLLFNKIHEFEKIIEQYQDEMFSFAFYRLGSFEVAQDIVQDVFLKFYEDKRLLQHTTNLRLYLFRSISNACIDYHRKNSKIHLENIDTIEDKWIDEEKKQSISEFFRIEDLLKDLSSEQAEVIKLKFVDGLNFVESAEVLNENVNTIKSRYKYALEKLRKLDVLNIENDF